MSLLLILPILVPLVTAAVCMLFWTRIAVQRLVSIGGAVALLAAGVAIIVLVWRNGIQVVQAGGWPAPYGITIVADMFSAIMVLLTGIVGVSIAIASLVGIDRRREAFGYYPLFQVLLMGVCGAFLTGDLFNLYVWFEVLLIASFVLMTLGGERPQLEGAIKYVTLNLISSSLFLSAIGILYGQVGTLNMADLAVKLTASVNADLITALAMMFLVAFGIKAAIFPLFFWLPASYHTPPVIISALFAALLTKVGVYALMRTFTLLFVTNINYTHTIILILAGCTMLTGVLGAIAQKDFRRLLSFLIVSEIGFLLMGLGLFTPLALAGSVFFMAHAILTMTALFLISGLTYRLSDTFKLADMGGLYRQRPLLAGLFFIPAFGLAGIPPMSGFFAKLTLIEAAIEIDQYAIVAAALTVSLLTLIAVTKVWNEVFWKPAPESSKPLPAEARRPMALIVPVTLLVAIVLGMGLAAEPMLRLSTEAGEQLINREGYIETVLGNVENVE